MPASSKELVIKSIMSDLSTDLSNLDSVWTNHPLLVARYSIKQAECERAASEEKERVAGLESALYNIVRSTRNMSGTKSSESSVEAMVKQIERHYADDIAGVPLNNSFIKELDDRVPTIAKALFNAKTRYAESKEFADIYKSAVEALRHRRDMIVQASKKAILDYEILGSGTFTGKKS